jgi:hypothetical protein
MAGVKMCVTLGFELVVLCVAWREASVAGRVFGCNQASLSVRDRCSDKENVSICAFQASTLHGPLEIQFNSLGWPLD